MKERAVSGGRSRASRGWRPVFGNGRGVCRERLSHPFDRARRPGCACGARGWVKRATVCRPGWAQRPLTANELARAFARAGLVGTCPVWRVMLCEHAVELPTRGLQLELLEKAQPTRPEQVAVGGDPVSGEDRRSAVLERIGRSRELRTLAGLPV